MQTIINCNRSNQFSLKLLNLNKVAMNKSDNIVTEIVGEEWSAIGDRRSASDKRTCRSRDVPSQILTEKQEPMFVLHRFSFLFTLSQRKKNILFINKHNERVILNKFNNGYFFGELQFTKIIDTITKILIFRMCT